MRTLKGSFKVAVSRLITPNRQKCNYVKGTYRKGGIRCNPEVTIPWGGGL